MTIENIRANQFIIFECISGSRAYGLETENSDTDIKGVFIAPLEKVLGFECPEQFSNESGDIVFFEIQKFLELVTKSNPSALEMLYSPEDCVLHEDPLFAEIRQHNFLSRGCQDTFVGYANDQLKKARGLKKKLVNPMERERLPVSEFCYVIQGKGAVKLEAWLKVRGFNQSECGLAGIDHLPGMHALYCSREHKLRGIVCDDGNDVRVSSIPKELNPAGYLFFNKEAYQAHCRRHKEYWEWAEKRNPDRFELNMKHGKNYDSKNMMHVFRLLELGQDIALNGSMDIRTKERAFLLNIKAGNYSYEELVELAEEKMALLSDAFRKSDLPEKPDSRTIEKLLITIRKKFDSRNKK